MGAANYIPQAKLYCLEVKNSFYIFIGLKQQQRRIPQNSKYLLNVPLQKKSLLTPDLE